MALTRFFGLPGVTLWISILAFLYYSRAEDVITNARALRKKTSETNVFNFLRLFVLRMIYGFANMFGFGEFLEDFAGGIFAPPTPEYDSFDYADDNDYKEYTDYFY